VALSGARVNFWEIALSTLLPAVGRRFWRAVLAA
jgi:hypothetical protein